jgi:hypothetical protein
MAPARARDGGFACGQLPDDLLQLPALEPFATGQRTQHRQAKQGFRVDLVHAHSLQVKGSGMKPEAPK